MKPSANILHMSGLWWKGFQGQRWVINGIIVKKKVEATASQQCMQYSTLHM